MVKQLQLFNRSAFYRKFVEHGFFVPLSSCLMQPSPCTRLASIDVLLSTVQHRRMPQPSPRESPPPPLFWGQCPACVARPLSRARERPPARLSGKYTIRAAASPLSGMSRRCCDSTCCTNAPSAR